MECPNWIKVSIETEVRQSGRGPSYGSPLCHVTSDPAIDWEPSAVQQAAFLTGADAVKIFGIVSAHRSLVFIRTGDYITVAPQAEETCLRHLQYQYNRF